MINAKNEFIGQIGNKKVLCCCLIMEEKSLELTTGWTNDDWNLFISSIDFEYDNGWGSQELFGTIWYTDGTWSERKEYDGSERWEYKSCPEIPKELNRIDKVRDIKINEILKMEKFKDVKISENVITNKNGHQTKITIMVGGLHAQSPKGYMDEAVKEYTNGKPHNQFIVIQLDNPWTRIITSDIQSQEFVQFDGQKL